MQCVRDVRDVSEVCRCVCVCACVLLFNVYVDVLQ